MIDRIIIFLVLGLFVFSPGIQSFWSSDPVSWYGGYIVWFLLVFLSWLATPRRRQHPAAPPKNVQG